MSASPIDVTALSSAVAGLAATAATAARAFLESRRQRQEAQRLEARSAATVLEGGDLQSVGDYLFKTLGQVRLGDYVADGELRMKTVQAIERISAFIGDPEGTSVAAGDARQVETVTADAVLDEAEVQISGGNVWNALAAARRLVELQLRDLFPQTVAPRMSAGQMLSLIERQLPPDNDAVREMRGALTIANAAIHGEEVDPARALDAIRSIRYGLRRLSDATRS